MNNLLSVTNTVKHFPEKGTGKTIKAVDGLSLSITRGEAVGLIGESGCGKSTLAKLLVGLEHPTSGDILIEGQNQKRLLKENRLGYYRRIQMVFQNPFDVFDGRYTIGQTLLRTLEIHKRGHTRQERQEILQDLLSRASLTPAGDYLSRYPGELSGGQLQRIAVLRSMLLQPDLLIADEPVTMLDVSIRAGIIGLLMEMRKSFGTALLFISHDIATTAHVSERILVMYLGRIVESGTTRDILNRPGHPYTKALLSNSGSLKGSRYGLPVRLMGEPPAPIDTGPGCYFAPRCPKATEICFKTYPPEESTGNGHTLHCFHWNS